MEEDFSIPFSLFGVRKVQEFVGRKKELIRIKEAIQGDGSQRKVVVLHGLGGIGKTQLAAAFLKQQRNIYPAIFLVKRQEQRYVKAKLCRHG